MSALLRIRSILESPFADRGVTEQEAEALWLALQGQSGHMIASNLNLPVGTANSHVYSGLAKLGTSKAELGWWVLRRIHEALG